MVFLFGLIPVAGAIISSIPLALLGFKIGGLTYVFYIIILVVSIHILEAYILNPRIFSSVTHLPVFITLVVLLISEHTFGPWGLIYGLPFFVFILESVRPTDNSHENESKGNKRIKARNTSA
jgi:predicted PurR-regulated permease PerM